MQPEVIDNSVPAHVVTKLRTEIIASHARPREDGTHWSSFSAPPGLLFEQAIAHLRRFVPGDFAGAEWWFRATTADTGCPFHFDRDEGVRNKLVSPAVTSILYLSNAGGPTVFLENLARGIAVHPRAGRFAMFPGTMLHGVLPTRPSRWPRITMLINWWREEPRMESARPQRHWTPASGPWRAGSVRAATLEPIDPTRLMAKAAWRELIADARREQ